VRCDDENGPKRRVLRRLGLRYVFFFVLAYLFILTDVLLYRYVLNYEIHDVDRNGRRDDENGPKRRCLGPRYVFF
jgi:hypothetical protein